MSTKKGSKKIKTLELFAGVGGFRLGLEGWNGKSATTNYKKNIETKKKRKEITCNRNVNFTY